MSLRGVQLWRGSGLEVFLEEEEEEKKKGDG